MSKFCLLLLFTILVPRISIFAQDETVEKKENLTPYELMSSYYSNQFNPFAKNNAFIGLSFSLEDKKLTNTDYLVQKVIDGERLDYDLLLKGGYYTGNYGMAGLAFNYYQDKFQGDVFRDPDTLISNTITRGFAFIPYFRSSVPLTNNERLSFFTELGVRMGASHSLTRNTKNLDEVEKTYGTNYNFRLGISPGVTFFVMEAFALEVQLNVLGYELRVEEKSVNNGESSKTVRQNVDFNINLLSLQLGLAYYLGAKKH